MPNISKNYFTFAVVLVSAAGFLPATHGKMAPIKQEKTFEQKMQESFDRQSRRLAAAVVRGLISEEKQQEIIRQQAVLRSSFEDMAKDGFSKDERAKLRELNREASNFLYEAVNNGERLKEIQERLQARIERGAEEGQIAPLEKKKLNRKMAELKDLMAVENPNLEQTKEIRKLQAEISERIQKFRHNEDGDQKISVNRDGDNIDERQNNLNRALGDCLITNRGNANVHAAVEKLRELQEKERVAVRRTLASQGTELSDADKKELRQLANASREALVDAGCLKETKKKPKAHPSSVEESSNSASPGAVSAE